MLLSVENDALSGRSSCAAYVRWARRPKVRAHSELIFAKCLVVCACAMQSRPIDTSVAGAADLVLEDVNKSFGSVTAVSDLSITVRPGEFYSLLGPSGCGKTTTLRLIAGFESPDTGRIRLAGTDITRQPPNKRKVNTVFQHYALFPHLTVEGNVVYGLRQDRLPKTQIASKLEQVLATVRLQDLRGRYPRELSGGQRQRVALARALIKEPTVLLLDEPLAALDLKLRKAMQHQLKQLQERVGITFIYVTHDQQEALALSDRIAVMSDGVVLQEGAPQEIYERPSSRFVADFIGQTNFLEGVVEDTASDVVVRDLHTGTTLRCAPADGVSPGMQVTVTVRPEAIIPVTEGHPPPANVVRGQVTAMAYLGDVIQYAVAVGPTQLMVQRQTSDPSLAAWRPGDHVTVGWETHAARVLRDAGHVAGETDRQLLEAPGR